MPFIEALTAAQPGRSSKATACRRGIGDEPASRSARMASASMQPSFALTTLVSTGRTMVAIHGR